MDALFARPINVCHLGKYYPPAPGGIESHVCTLARAQAALGAQVRVVCINHCDQKGRDVTWKRYGITRTVEEQDGLVRVTRLGRSACMARLDVIPDLPRVLKELQYSNADIVHLHTPNPTMLLMLACLRLNKPIVVTHHSDVISQTWLVHFMRPVERIVYRRAAAILSDSEGYIAGSAVLQSHQKKVETLPLGIELSRFLQPTEASVAHEHRLRQELGDAPLWLSVGRCVPYKGFHVGIEALAKVPGRWMIVGTGPQVEPLRARAQQLGVADRIIFRGKTDDDELAAAYRVATALWFPSCMRSEGFGLVQVEAMASGCPVINTSIFGSGVSWVSLNDVSGLTVPVGDASALANASNRLLGESTLRPRLSRGAVERAKTEFAETQMAERSLSVYSRLLKRAQVGGRAIDAVVPTEPRLVRWIQSSHRPHLASGEFDAAESLATPLG